MTIVTTQIGALTKYVSKYYQGSTGVWIFELTTKEENAHNFGSVIKAAEAIEKHANFHNRKYKIISNNKEAKKVSGAIFGIDKKLN